MDGVRGTSWEKIKHDHVDTIRKYVQYMMLTKSLDYTCDVEGKQEDSGEEEFCLE